MAFPAFRWFPFIYINEPRGTLKPTHGFTEPLQLPKRQLLLSNGSTEVGVQFQLGQRPHRLQPQLTQDQ